MKMRQNSNYLCNTSKHQSLSLYAFFDVDVDVDVDDGDDDVK